MMSAYHRRLTGRDAHVQLECARSWSSWEMSTSRLIVDHNLLKRVDSDLWALQFAKIEAYVALCSVLFHIIYRVAPKNGATGHPISLQIFRKLHDRIAWTLADFCNIIC